MLSAFECGAVVGLRSPHGPWEPLVRVRYLQGSRVTGMGHGARPLAVSRNTTAVYGLTPLPRYSWASVVPLPCSSISYTACPRSWARLLNLHAPSSGIFSICVIHFQKGYLICWLCFHSASSRYRDTDEHLCWHSEIVSRCESDRLTGRQAHLAYSREAVLSEVTERPVMFPSPPIHFNTFTVRHLLA